MANPLLAFGDFLWGEGPNKDEIAAHLTQPFAELESLEQMEVEHEQEEEEGEEPQHEGAGLAGGGHCGGGAPREQGHSYSRGADSSSTPSPRTARRVCFADEGAPRT